jgi:DNA-directed RNA polymerase subunit H
VVAGSNPVRLIPHDKPTRKTMAKKTTTRKPIKVLKKKVVKAPSKKKKEVIEQPIVDAFNPSEHNLVAKHEVLTQEQVEALFTTYHVSPQSLPVIFMNDAALKGLTPKMGDIIKVTRNSPTAGQAVFYRRVAYE